MHFYDYPLYRPPAEADSLIIQATLGCSHNRCTFCTMYKSKRYQVRALTELFEEIDALAASYPLTRRIFLADGDALALPTPHLLKLLQYLQQSFPKLGRISLYATAQNLLEKPLEALKQLREHKLSLLYFGIESGHDALLRKIDKGVNSGQIIEALDKASLAGMKVSATVILGLGGAAYSKAHIAQTARLINRAPLTYLSTLQLGLEDDAKERFKRAFQEGFTMLDDYSLLDEQKELITLLDPASPIIFRSNHASNALPLKGTLPKDKARLLKAIDAATARGSSAFVPLELRGF